MNSQNQKIVNLMNYKADALDRDEFSDERILLDILGWDKSRAEKVIKVVNASIDFMLSIDAGTSGRMVNDSELCPHCIDTQGDNLDNIDLNKCAKKCKWAEIFGNCLDANSVYRDIVASSGGCALKLDPVSMRKALGHVEERTDQQRHERCKTNCMPPPTPAQAQRQYKEIPDIFYKR
ncbi:hypothetical protein [Desulfoluna butyratoxydans]|uniref:Uncharacterized protein n=1 Tax=Desulfoluna butyratoxydans TaxID=231438 RepID=A0A4U8YJE1_9BACT|nr:hypothetical protein [Desulfoluna butyratoxydans]VFQ43866.1 hypothetical protein MSL71_15080 [Desulfoluna butyratoxydans]